MSDMELITRRAVRTQTNVLFLSPPGRGKTAKNNLICAALQAEDPDFFVADFDGGTMSPTDTVMSMPDMVERTVVQLRDSRLPDVRKTPDLKGIINIHEMMLMGVETHKGFQKLVNHERDGMGFAVPPGVIFRGDGNRLVDRSGGQQQSRAYISRFRVYTLAYDPEYNLQVVKDNYHERVAAFLIRNPAYLDTYEEVFEGTHSANDLALQEGKNGAWPNLRTWQAVSAAMRDADETGVKVLPDEIIACVGSATAGFFDVFCNMLDNLATMEDIIAKPKEAPVPERMDQRYALSTMLSLTVNKDTFKPVSVYMNRYPHELQASFFRLMNDRLAKAKDGNNSAIRSSDEYKRWITAKHITTILTGAST